LVPFLAFAAGCATWLTGFLSPVDRALQDGQTHWLAHRVDSNVAIVEIDARSLHELGTWPWRRERHARLLERLESLGARNLFIDIDFSAPSNHPEDDQRLARALAQSHGTVVLPAFWQSLSSEGSALILSNPLPALTASSHVRTGSVNLVPDVDGLVREIPDLSPASSDPVVPVWRQLLPAAQHTDNAPLRLDFRIAASSFQHLSYIDILDGRATPNLAGKTVFIGATAVELGDIVPVPVQHALPGVVVQAIAYETAMRAPLVSIGPGAMLAALLAWALCCAGWLIRVRWMKALRVASILVAFQLVANTLAYATGNVLFRSSPFLVTALSALVFALLRSLNIEAFRALRAGRRLRHQGAMLRQIVDTSVNGILTLDDSGNILDANRAAATILGRSLVEVIGQPCHAILPQLHADIHSLSDKVSLLRRSYDHLQPDGSSIPTEVALTRLAWEETFITCITLQDVSAQKKRERDLHYHATHDGLTGIPNRRHLTSILRGLLSGGDPDRRFAVLMLGLDGLSQVNDIFGHSTGDEVLIQLGRRLQALDTGCRCVASMGGAKFALLFTHSPDDSPTQIARQVQAVTEAPIMIRDVPISLGARFGVCLFPAHGRDAELLLQRADIALSSAKRKRTAQEVYDSSLDVGSPRRLQMLAQLRSAIAKQELSLHFQPKVHLSTGSLLEVEALCRWESLVLGNVAPAEFIPLVEASDLVRPLTEWTLREALQHCRQWRKRGHLLNVAVNLSARHLQEEGFSEWLAGLIASCEAAPGWLELEITESAIMTDTARALATLRAVRELGVTLSIDDYGTGYSSLAYLQKLAVHRLKIDRSFVAGMESSQHDRLIVKSTIDLAHQLGLEVIAEGIETQGQYALLQTMGCDVGQGYLIARPMPDELLMNWYTEHGQVALAG
jgi:diguanylate cyclase (GGDEF)-like protein/PAS domain S-box-containing protein